MPQKLLRKIYRQAGLACLVLWGVGCENPSGKLVGVPPTETRKTEGAGLQTFSPSVDILFVIDDSGSMATHQINLKNNVDLFTQGLTANKFVDYHIGVVTTDDQYYSFRKTGGGVLVGSPNYVDRSTPRGTQVLQQNIMVGTSGSATEKSFDPIWQALSEPVLSNFNQGFYRPSAYLAVIFITDAEDQSTRLNPQQLEQFLLGLKNGDSSKILSYGVIVPSNTTTACARDEARTPQRIEEFFSLTGGKYYGLCDPDYGTKLALIGEDLVERVGRRVLLDRRPILDTVQVKYGSQEIPPHPESGWSYDASENAIVLGRKITWTEQPKETIVEVLFRPVEQE